MNVTFACPNCEGVNRQECAVEDPALSCAECGLSIQPPAGAVENGEIKHCLVCPSEDLFVRKDFPQRLGVALVAIGVIGSSIAWYYGDLNWTFGILGTTAILDLILYAIVGNALMCYRCQAQYRGLSGLERYAPFDLETHEKHRQQLARLHEQKRLGTPAM